MIHQLSSSIKSLVINVLNLPKTFNHVYQLARLTIQLILSANNRGFLGPLSILIFLT